MPLMDVPELPVSLCMWDLVVVPSVSRRHRRIKQACFFVPTEQLLLVFSPCYLWSLAARRELSCGGRYAHHVSALYWPMVERFDGYLQSATRVLCRWHTPSPVGLNLDESTM